MDRRSEGKTSRNVLIDRHKIKNVGAILVIPLLIRANTRFAYTKTGWLLFMSLLLGDLDESSANSNGKCC